MFDARSTILSKLTQKLFGVCLVACFETEVTAPVPLLHALTEWITSRVAQHKNISNFLVFFLSSPALQ